MHATESVTTTSTRRSAMRFSLAALTAGLTVPVLASTPNPDAELIRLCDRTVDLEAQFYHLHDTIEDDDERDRLINPICAEQKDIDALVRKMGNPRTIEGARSMARVALAFMPINRQGEREVGHNPEDWYFACIAEFLTGDVA